MKNIFESLNKLSKFERFIFFQKLAHAQLQIHSEIFMKGHSLEHETEDNYVQLPEEKPETPEVFKQLHPSYHKNMGCAFFNEPLDFSTNEYGSDSKRPTIYFKPNDEGEK